MTIAWKVKYTVKILRTWWSQVAISVSDNYVIALDLP